VLLLLRVPPARRGKVVIDWLGITLMTAMISALVMAATWAGSTYAWGSWQILGLGAAVVVLLIAFIAAEQRAAEPLLPPRIFTRRRNFPIAASCSPSPRGHVRRHALPAALPTDRPGRLGSELWPAAACR